VKIKLFIYCLVLIAYSLSIAHSLIPHSHFNSLGEFKSAHTHDADEEGNHEHNHENEGTSDSGLFFLTHTANIDFLPSTSVPDKKVVSKNFQFNTAATLQISILTDVWFVDKVFHIPIKPPRRDYSLFSTRLLRAPPIFS